MPTYHSYLVFNIRVSAAKNQNLNTGQEVLGHCVVKSRLASFLINRNNIDTIKLVVRGLRKKTLDDMHCL